jgi:dual serine/threonine and tyrosine protein kinase
LPYDLVSYLNDNWRLIRIRYGKFINLAYHLIDSEFELMSLKHAEDANNNNHTTTIQLDDLRLNNELNNEDSIDNSAIVDLTIQSKVLESNVEIIVHTENVPSRSFDNLTQNKTKILIYGIYDDKLNEKELNELNKLAQNWPIFFIKISKIDDSNEFLANPSKYLLLKGINSRNDEIMLILKQLYEPHFNNDKTQETSELCDKWSSFGNKLSLFIKKQFRLICVQYTTQLFKFHEECLNNFINYAYDCARDMQFTPKKLEYAKDKEQILFETLNRLASIKQEELKHIIGEIIESNREAILQEVRLYEFGDLKDCKMAAAKIEELVINRLNTCISQQLTETIEVLKENYIGTLKRCLETLEENRNEAILTSGCASGTSVLVEDDSVSASKALKEILTSAYQVDVTLNNTSTINIIKLLMERIKELLKTMPWSQVPKLDEQWRLQIAMNMLSNLSETKLAKILSIQMKERLKASHNQFTTSMKLLEAKHTGRLEKAEEIQIQIRKNIAPKFAKLCLESTSLKDLVLNGMPLLGKEIGRGQYGVVYSCTKWSKYTNLAIKSVVPPDEKHWNDLALEFHYTKSIQGFTFF